MGRDCEVATVLKLGVWILCVSSGTGKKELAEMRGGWIRFIGSKARPFLLELSNVGKSKKEERELPRCESPTRE